MAYFSVVVPVYNKAGALDNCINSLINQTYSDFEVIFVNDGSTDNSVEEIKEKTGLDKRFRLVEHEKNMSVSTARFTGMEDACGEYLFFMDSDDAIETNSFEKIKESLEKNPVDILRYNHIEEPSKKVKPLATSDNMIRDILLGTIPPAVWRSCYSKKVYKGACSEGEKFYSNMGEDMYLATVLFSQANTIGALDEPLYHYDTSSGMSSTVAKPSIEKFQRDKKNIDEVATHLRKYAKSRDDIQSEWVETCIRQQYLFIIVQQLKKYAADEEMVKSYLEIFATDEHKELVEYATRVLNKLKEQILSDNSN